MILQPSDFRPRKAAPEFHPIAYIAAALMVLAILIR